MTIGAISSRGRGSAVRKIFKHYGLQVSPVHDRADVKGALKSGRLVLIKTTVDFLDWVPATWFTPDGDTFPAVLGNDHAAIVIGYDDNVVVMRDVLGPTDTNWNRQYEYEIPWNLFLKCWERKGSTVLPSVSRTQRRSNKRFSRESQYERDRILLERKRIQR